MKRLKSTFYKELRELRDNLGNTEYDRSDIRGPAVVLLKQFITDPNALWDDAADKILDGIEKAEDTTEDHPDLFPYLAHVALGEGKRIRRGRMNLDQMRRRKPD